MKSSMLSIVLTALAVGVVIAGFSGSMSFAAMHIGSSGVRDLLCVAGCVAVFLLSLAVATVLFIAAHYHMVLKRPVRNLRNALRYWRPKRLTLSHHPRIHAWLWWNY